MKTLITFAACLLAAVGIQAQQVAGNASYTNALTVYNAPLKLQCVTGYNSASTRQFVQVFNTVTGATNGAVPTFSFPVPPTNYFSLDFSSYGANLDKCKVCVSSNANSLALTAATVSIQAVFKSPQ